MKKLKKNVIFNIEDIKKNIKYNLDYMRQKNNQS